MPAPPLLSDPATVRTGRYLDFFLAVKTGMLYSSEVVDAVAGSLGRHHAGNLVVDPVMISTSGSRLISADAVEVMVHRLFPLAMSWRNA